MPQSAIDITGQQFGRLTVTHRVGTDNGGNAMWSCVCDCGGTATVRGSHLRGGRVTCCGGKGRGCKRVLRADITGKVFGRLTVVRRNGYKVRPGQRRQLWECRCECGEIMTTVAIRLRNGTTVSCGCYNREQTVKRSTKHGRYYTVEYRLMHGAKQRARRQGIEFSITLDDIIVPDLCPLLGVRIAAGQNTIQPNSPTLDRIDPRKGYVRGNVWVISQKANQMKSDNTVETMRFFIQVIEAKLLEIGG